MCRTQNGTTESIPQTITTQPFFIQFETIFLLMKLNLQQTVTGATAHIARTSMSTKCPRGQIQHRMPILMENVETPGSLVIKQGSPKPKGQLAPIVGTGKGTAALLTCPLRECQFFEKKATRALYVRWGSYKCRLQSRPGLGAALFTRSMAQYRRIGWPKVNLLGNFNQGHGVWI